MFFYLQDDLFELSFNQLERGVESFKLYLSLSLSLPAARSPLLMLHAFDTFGYDALVDPSTWSIAQQMLSVQIAL